MDLYLEKPQRILLPIAIREKLDIIVKLKGLAVQPDV